MEHAIGEIATHVGIDRIARRIQAVKAKTAKGRCSKCFFDNNWLSCVGYECEAEKRTDHKNIIYKEVIKEK